MPLVGKLVVPEATLTLNLFDTNVNNLLVLVPLPIVHLRRQATAQ